MAELHLRGPSRRIHVGEALRFGLGAVATFCVVSYRRLLGEPLHPGWSFRKEVATMLMRDTFTRMTAMPPAEMRARTLPTPIPLSIARSIRHQATDLGGCEAEVFTPKEWSEQDGIVCLYIPGGGYIGCSPLTHRNLVSRIAAASGARCFALDYRKAPHFPFPTPIDDCVAAYRHLLQVGIDPRRIVLAGDSAGGGLAVATMLRARETALALPRCAVLLSPWVDLACSRASLQTNARFDYLSAENLAFAIQQYIGAGDARHPHVSPLRADLTGLPPMLVQTGSAELFRDQNHDFVAHARAHGVRVEHDVGEGMVHVYATFAGFVPECTPAVRRIASFIRRESDAEVPFASAT